MSIKKFIAYITAISIVALSFGMTAFAADKPTADAGTTVCDGAYIVGSYTYTGEQPQGNSIYRWYISDSFSDKGTLAEGQDGLTFKASNATAGKFITFAVVPVDENGNQGDEVCADPVMQNSGYYEDFSSTPAGLETLTTAEGHVKIVNDPAGGEDMALSVYKKSSSSFKTEARLNFDSVAAAKTVVDVQLYATDIAGTAKLFGVYCDAYGSVMELQTDASGKLYYRGGNGLKQAVVDFPTDSWNHLVMEINGEDKTVKATLNGNNIFRDSDTESWRFKNDEYNNVAASFLNYGNGGTVYIKNLVVMDVSGEISAQADAEWLEDAVPYEAEKDITLPSTGKNGSYIYWKSSMPQYITDEGVVTRPKYEEGNVDVVLTAYIFNGSASLKKEITVTVIESPVAPVAENVVIAQNSSRAIVASYTYYDENSSKENGTIYQWYVEQNGKYIAIDGANDTVFVPTEDYDGKNIRFSVTPRNKDNVVGEETFSEPISYVYYDTQIPTAQIDSIKLTNGAFVMKYTYVSPDYLPEGATAIQWYMSDSLFGDYQIIDGAGSDTYTPADKTAYYKVAVNPVDKEGNAGEEIMSDAFMYTDVADSSTAVSSAIAAITLPENTNVNLEFLTEDENGVYYTWVSSDESIIAADGTIYRPAKDAEDVSVNITVYAVCGFDIKSAEYTVVVNKYSTAPVITAAALGQTARPIVVDYTFEDADGDAEGETVYEWYYKADADSEFTLIEGASSSMYAPSSNMDGYIFIAKITPADATYTYGEQYTTAEYTYTYQSPAIPSAQVGTVDYGIGALTGVYTYTNIDGIAEGDSDYQWYVSKTLLGEYSAIEGETGISLRRSSDYDGKFIKFSVTPKDAEGVTGETVYSNPVHMESYEPETFDDESVIASSVDASALKGGTVEIVEDPADSSNNVLALTRTSQTNGEMSMISVLAPSYSGMKGMVMDIDVYPSSSLSGTWEMLYIGGTGHGYKLWHSGRSSLLSRGGATYINGVWKEDSTYTVSTAFTKDNWHHIRVVQDFNNQMTLETSLDGEVVQTDIPFRCAINTVEKITSFIQNSFVGTGYMDNFVITPIYDATNMAVVDANAINLGSDLTSVISNLKLPTIGETNDSIIVWTSSDDSVITSKGKVIRPESAEGDKTVTLTAHVIKCNDYYERDFEVTVIRNLLDEEIAEYDSNALNSYDNMIVDGNITLPSKGSFGAEYTWVSSDESIISNTGAVTMTDDVQNVSFEVTVTYDDYSETKTINMIVAPDYGDNLIINGGIASSSAKSQYPAMNAIDGDYTTHWSSLTTDSSPYVVVDMGKSKKVNRLYVADTTAGVNSVSLSASADKNTWSDVKITKNIQGGKINIVEFDEVNTRYIRIYPTGNSEIRMEEIALFYVESDSDKVTNGIDDITLPVSGNVTADFELITQLADGTKVEWTSSNTDVISISGSTANVSRASSDKSVTLTATITSGGESAQKSFVVVVPGKSSGSSGGGGGSSSGSSGSSGGSLSTSGVTSAVGSIVPAITPDVQSGKFADVADVPWAVDAINRLSAIGVVNGTSATTFEPARSITRAEFAAILYRGFGFDKVAASGSYSDVQSSDWYYEPVMQLSSLGIITGIGDGSFGAGSTITRQDMAVMIYRAASVVSAQFTAAGSDFADKADIAGYAATAVDALSGAQIINGVGDGRFNPLGNATRAEATVILSRILDYFN